MSDWFKTVAERPPSIHPKQGAKERRFGDQKAGGIP